MQSIPIIRLLIMCAALAVAAIGVWNVTHPVEAQAGTPTATVATPAPVVVLRSVIVELTVSQGPADYEIVTGSGPSLKGVIKNNDAKCQIDLNMPAAGEDWIVRVHWKNKSVPSAVRVLCRDAASGQKLADATFWGKGDVEDTVGIQ